MRDDKARAIKLRKQGNSYAQINTLLGIPKSTLSYWLRNLEISEKAKKKISKRVAGTSISALIRRNKNQTKLAFERAEKIRKNAAKEAGRLMRDPLFVSGISLYWAEGYKRGADGSKWKSVDFANSDPEMVKLMMEFFRNVCKVEENKFKAQIIAHKNVDIKKAVGYWSNLTNIGKECFIKTYNSTNGKAKNKRRGNRLTYGTIHIRINDVNLFFKIIGWIDGFKEKCE